MTTLGQQSKLLEGHYVHHFSINPQNLEAMKKLSDNSSGLMIEDISKLKEAMRRGVSYYDSSSKAGTDNEFLLWIQLKKYSSLVLPVFTEFINVTRENDSVIIDCGNLKEILSKISDELDQIEVYYLPENTQVRNLPDNIILYDITTGKEL
jgi:CRISPR-associated protein Csh2